MSYRILVGQAAAKSLAKKVHSGDVDRIRAAIDALAADPRPFPQSAKLEGREGRRLRVGSYRVLYTVDDERREVLIAEVWHRQRDYR